MIFEISNRVQVHRYHILKKDKESTWENEISGSISSAVSCITERPGSGPGQSECSSSASPSSLPSLCSASQSLELLKLLLHPPSSISMRSRPAAPSSPRLTVLLLPLLSTSPDSTLFSPPFPLPRRHGVTFSSRFMMARPAPHFLLLIPSCLG